MWKKTVLSLAAVIVLAAAYVRPVYSVELGGVGLPGSWDRASIRRAAELARAAGEELSRSGAEPAGLTAHMRLSLKPAEGDAQELARAMLAEYPGVDRVWEVRVDGIEVGLAADRSALGEVLMAAIAEASPPDSLRTGFDSEIALREVFVTEGNFTDLMDISGRIRSLARVTYVSPDGELHYA